MELRARFSVASTELVRWLSLVIVSSGHVLQLVVFFSCLTSSVTVRVTVNLNDTGADWFYLYA